MARMVFGSGAAKGPDGQEKGHIQQRQSVKGEYSVCETDPRISPPLRVRRGSYVRGFWRRPFGFIFQSGDESFQRWRPLPAAELFTCCHISAAYCTSQHFRGGSACSGLAALCRWPTAEAFNVWYEIRLQGRDVPAAALVAAFDVETSPR